MLFDNHDERIRYIEVRLKRDLNDLPEIPLPEGYRFVFYTPGDRDHWIAIEQSAKEFSCYEDGLKSWNDYFGGKDHELISRMVFVENESGEKVATATAFYDIFSRDNDGWMHWVAVRRDHQGKGLSKPLISYVLRLLRDLGYTCAKVSTQTNTWLACKIYLDFGFLPTGESIGHFDEMGWQIIKTLTDHPALQEYKPVSFSEILDDNV